MPLVLAAVGTLGTCAVTEQQRKSAEIRAAADRQLEMVNIFTQKMTSEEEDDRIFALFSLLSLDSDLAAKLLPTFVYREGSDRYGIVRARGIQHRLGRDLGLLRKARFRRIHD